MRKIEKIVVGGQEFEVMQHEREISRGVKHISYTVRFSDGSEKKLRAEYETDMVEALIRSNGINADDVLVDVAEQEIRMEIFEHIHGVKMVDVISGKHPDLLVEYVKSHLDVNYLEPEVQEKHIDIIAEAMKEDQ